MLLNTDIAKPAWAIFDAAWYLRSYKTARDECGEDNHAALAYYVSKGVRLRHSPSPLFDESFYLESNPDILQLIELGQFESGFDHFCRSGHRVLSPHWLFDDQLYGRLYEDMSLENLDLHGCVGRYDHYLKSGQFERRQAHFLFDGTFYRSEAMKAGRPESELESRGPFVHYLYHLAGSEPELSPSIYFDVPWYLQHAAGVKSDIERGNFGSAIEHYLRNKTPAVFDPVPQFSEPYYCETNRDVNHAVDNGDFRSGYQHFVQFGAFELRRPHPKIDLVYYRDMNGRVGDDINSGAVRDAFAHLRLIGVPQKLEVISPDVAVDINENVAKRLFLQKAEENLLSLGRHKLDFRCSSPVAAIIMVAFNRFALTMLALTSLRANFARDLQLILVDNGSSDETKWVERYLEGAIILHFEQNMGFSRAANIALQHVSAPVTFYLNNDIELGHAAVSAALQRLESAADIGAVGGKIIRSHGKLQEAGSIIWNDGTVTGYLRDASPTLPEANFVREVDFCSAVFLACRTSVLRSLNGFDENFSPAYYEDADLCVRLIKAGYKIIYDPSVVVHHLEFGSAATSDASMALMRRGHRIFTRKHQEFIQTKSIKSPENIITARSSTKLKKILFVEDTIPLRRLGSGFVRSNDVVKAIVHAGHEVSIFPVNGASQMLANLLDDFPDHVEILNDRDFTVMRQFLSERSGIYDLIWISRTHNLTRTLPLFLEAGITPETTAFVLDTEAVASLRDASRSLALCDERHIDVNPRLVEEFLQAQRCTSILAVNHTEVELLTGLGLPRVSLLGTARQAAPTGNGFSSRQGLLFVASIHQMDSPNLDSLYWFRDHIFPWLSQEMEQPPILNFVGHIGDDIDLSDFADDPRIVIHGPVDDLMDHYNANRVFIAPTRFAAGTPYKIYEAASFGLPCVTTDLLARQLGWSAGLELLAVPVTDPRRFASQVAILYRTEQLWNKLRSQALQRLESENSLEKFNERVANILDQAFGAMQLPQRSTTFGKRGPPRKSVPVR
jgi:GT2 family glycosyltransferase